MTFVKNSLIICAIAAPTLAIAEVAPGDMVGSDEAGIITLLEGQGYEVLESEVEDGIFEVEAMLDGAEVEIEVDLATGLVAEVEMEGDEDDADDEDDSDDDKDDA